MSNHARTSLTFRNKTAVRRLAANYRKQFFECNPLRGIVRSTIILKETKRFRYDTLTCGHMVVTIWKRTIRQRKNRRCEECGRRKGK